ncbi:MAG: patatin-like phospholipase family protein, partial [Nitrososphaeraceae archaeon]
MSDTVENVLILQGGGSLGAFACGVFKALASSNIKIDIVAGTSIGGLNASIIAGNKEKDHPEKALEQFWLELAEGSSSGNPNFNFFPFMKSLSSASEHSMSTSGTSTSSSSSADHSGLTHISQLKSLISFYTSAIYGNKKVFMPRWRPEYAVTDPEYFV